MEPNDNPLEPLSPGEWHVVACVFDLRSANPIQVSAHLAGKYLRKSHPSTCGVLLARAAAKGYLSVTLERQAHRGRPLHVYAPKLAFQTALVRQFERFLETYLIGDEGLEILTTLLEAREVAQR